MSLSDKINIIESGPRDGFQSIKEFIEPSIKIDMIKQLIDSGAKSVEITSFVNPKWVPQFSDASQVFQAIKPYADERNVELIALVPNLKGALNAKAAGVEVINLVISASEVHNRKNVNKSINESLQDLKKIVSEVENIEIRLAIACALGSPFEDVVSYETLRSIIVFAREIGIKFIGVADSAGVSTPKHTETTLRKIISEFGVENLGLHLHDTKGMGLANAYVAMELGVMYFDASFGALGGCPFIPGAKGNIATEDLVNMAHSMGVKTGYDFNKLMDVVYSMEKSILTSPQSSMSKYYR